MKDELVRDSLVININDAAMSERLQTDETLIQDKAKKLAHQKDAVREQQSILKRKETTLDHIKAKEKFPDLTRNHPQNTRNAFKVANTPTLGKTAQQRTLRVTSVESKAALEQFASQK